MTIPNEVWPPYGTFGFPKKKPIRLKGKAKIDLYAKVWERDGGSCVECGQFVEYGTPPHHINGKKGGDIESNLQMLCNKHHYNKHHGGKK